MTDLTPDLIAAFDAVVVDSQQGGPDEKHPPPAGTIGEAVVTEARTGVAANRGEQYLAVNFEAANPNGQPWTWVEFKWLTKGGQVDAPRVKSAKILLNQLGFADVNGQTLGGIVASLPGRRYTFERFNSDTINTTTGEPFVNTKFLGQVPAQAGPAPQQQPAPVVTPQPQQFDKVPF